MELIQEFKNYLLSQKKQPSKATVKNYVADVRKFITWYEATSTQQFSPLGVTTETIAQYKATHIKEFSASSIDRHLSSLKKFFYFLKLEGQVPVNPFEQMQGQEPVRTDPLHLKEFKDFLYVYNASHLTIKNYLIDIKQFFTWLTEVAVTKNGPTETNLLGIINDKVIQEYTDRLYHTQAFSPASINRKLSSLRKYLSWAHEQGYLAPTVTTLPANLPNSLLNEAVKTVKTENNTNNEAVPTAYSEGVTRVEGPADAQRNEVERASAGGNEWQVPEHLTDVLTETQTTKEEEIQEEEPSYSKIPPVRLGQKIASLLSLGLEYIVIIPAAYLTTFVQHKIWLLKGKPLFSKKATKTVPPLQQSLKRFHIKNLPKSVYNPLGISITHFPWHKKVLYHIQYTRPQWYRNYSRLAAAKYFNMAILMIFCAMVGFGLYSTFFSNARRSPTLATGPVAPPRVLSFQGRLTDNNDNPITANTNLRFAIYNDASASGSALLWQEVDKVNPDTDGDFSTLLGNSTTIPQSLFAQNNALWLGVTVEWTPELAPRQQIATVAYATNSEVLQGMPPITQVGAGTQNVVLALDSSGNLAVGAATTFQSTSGTFTLSGNTLALTTNAGSNGNITLAPDGSGTIDLQKVVQNSTLNNNIPSAAGAVEIDDLLAVLATSSGQSAFTINQNGTGPLISASTSGTAKFTVDSSGNVTAAGNVTGSTIYTGGGTTYYINNNTSNLNSLTLAANLTVSGNVGSDLIPSTNNTYDLGSPSLNWRTLYVQNIVAPPTGGTSGYWQLNAGALAPTNITNDVLVGGISTASAKFQIFSATGNATTAGTLTFTGATPTIQTTSMLPLTIGSATTGPIQLSPKGTTGVYITGSGNVGVATNNPSYPLDVTGNARITSALGINGSLPGATVQGQASALAVTGYTGLGGLRINGADTTDTLYNGSSNIVISRDAGGFVELTKASTPTVGLLVNTSTGGVGINTGTTGIGNAQFVVNQANLSGLGDIIAASTAGTTKFRVDNSGNIIAAGNVTGNTIFTGNGTTYYINNTTSNLNSLTLAANLTVSGNVASDLIPSTSDTYSLGSDPTAAGKEWLNLYVKNLFLNGQALTQLFQRNAGVVSPINITDDLAVGGNSTASAKFQVFGLSGNATTAGTLTFNTNGTIQTTSMLPLVLGSATTGSIQLSPKGLAGLFVSDAGSVGIGTTTPLTATGLNIEKNSLGNATLDVNQLGTGDIFTASASGSPVFTIANDGSIKNNILPNQNNTYDLGAASQEWKNIYGQHIFSNGVELTQYWQRNSGALSPFFITDDLLLGATATTSARFAVTNIANGTPTASLSAGINSGTYLTADGTLATKALQSLTLGSTTTGNINIGIDTTGRAISIGNTTGTTSLVERVGTGNYSLDGTATSTYAIGSSTVGGTITIGGTGQTGTLTLGQSTAGQSINIGNANNTIAQQIQIANGASAATSEVDILSGTGTLGTSTLKLGNNPRVGTIDLGNVASNVTRTITIAGGNAANDDTVNILAGNPSLGTQTVNILTGNATGGTQALNLGTGTNAKTIAIGGTGANTITIGNTQAAGSISIGNALTSGTLSLGGTGAMTGSVTIGDGTGTQTIDLGNGSGNKTINIGGTGTSNTINIGSSQTNGIINIGVSGSLTTIKGSNFTAGGVAYATGSAMLFTSAGSAGQCLLSNGATAPSWGLCTYGNGNYWDLQQGALYPFNPTVDLLLGGSATSSAKFGVLNIAGGTPTASVSSGLNGTAMSIDANGNVQTANYMTLTLGGTKTGNIVLNPKNSTGTITFSGYSTGIIHSTNGLLSSSAVDLQNDITSTLRVNHGGTGLTSLASGSLIYGGGGATATELPIGNSNDVLAVVGGIPTWTPYATHSALFVNNNAQLNTVSSATNKITPTTNGTLDLGDGAHYFGTIYANNVVIPVGNGTSGFWQLASNVISPVNNFYDLSVGGSATGSATPWQVFATTVGAYNTAGTATSSGNLAFRGANTEIDLLNGTGLNIKSSVGGNEGLSSILNLTSAGNVTLAGTLAVNGNTLSTTTTSTFTLLNTTINTLNFAQGTSNLTIGSGGTTNTIFNGNLTLGDSVNLRTLTLGAKVNSDILPNGDSAHDLGATGDYWRNIYANNLFGNAVIGTSGYWQVNTNVLSPAFNWQNLALGGTATGSATFQVFANSFSNDLGTVLAGTASTSGSLTFKGGTTQVNLLSNSTLGFYNSVGGDKGITLTNPELYLNSNGTIGIGTTTPLATLDIRGNLTSSPVASISGTTSAAALTISNTGSGNYLDINNGGTNIASFIQSGSLGHNAFVPGATDAYDLGSNPTSGGREWDTLYVRQVITPSGSLGSNYWQLTNSVIAPSNLYNDLAVGGAATSSAKFQVFGNTGNATTSGTLTFNSASPVIQTTNMYPLTIGSASTGPIQLSPKGLAGLYVDGTGNVGIGTTSPNANLDVGGNGQVWIEQGSGGSLPTSAGAGLKLEANSNGGTLAAYNYTTNTYNNLSLNSGAGYVGIGTTAIGNAALAVNQPHTSGDILTASTSGTTKFVINNNGYVGIGSGLTNPQGILDVASNFTNLPRDLVLGQTTATNLMTNPSFEAGTTGWSLNQGGTGGTAAQSSAQNMFGSKSILLTNGTSWTSYGQVINVSSNTTYTLSAWVKSSAASNAKLFLNDQQASVTNYSSYHTGDGKWQRLTVTLTTGGSTTTMAAGIQGDVANTGTAYADGFQLETGSTATPYLDGSLGPGYHWTGTPNNSTSVRDGNAAFAYNTFNSASGIGASSASFSATLQLDQNGTGNIIAASASGITQFKVDNAGIVSANSFLDLQNSSYFLDPANTGTALTVAGKVGIGTTTPLAALQVVGSASVSADLTFSGAGTTHNIYTFDNGNLDFQMSPGGSVPSTGVVHALYLQAATGNVGIGTTSPTYKLTISGDDSAPADTTGGFSILAQSNSNQRLHMGYVTASDYAYIESVKVGTNLEPLVLNPRGGNVGIGTTSPTHGTLEVNGSIYADSAVASSLYAIGLDRSNGSLTFPDLYPLNGGALVLGGSAGGTSGKVYIATKASNDFALYVVNNNQTVNSHGMRIAAGTTSSSSTDFIQFTGGNQAVEQGSIKGGAVGGNIQYLSTSDRRIKTDIINTHFTLDDLLKVQVKDFHFTLSPNSPLATGFIAQDLYKVYPNVVNPPSNPEDWNDHLNLLDLWQVDYGGLTPLIVKGVQDLNAKVDTATASANTQLADLQQKVTNLINGNTDGTNIVPAQPGDNGVSPLYSIFDSSGNLITQTTAFFKLAVANLTAGSIRTQNMLTNTLAIATDNVSIAGQSLHDYIVNVVNQVLQNTQAPGPTSPIAEVDQIHTNLISPLASDSAILLDLHNSRIAVKNSATGETVASIDNSGNATFSGTLTGQNLAVNGDATVSGTLHADRIEANSIAGLQAVVSTLSAQNITNVTNIYFATPSADQSRENSATGSGVTGNNNYGLLTQSNGFADIASFSAYLSYVPNLKATTGMFQEGLISLGPTTLTDTSITGTLSIGSQMILADNSINVLGSDLELQPLKQGGIAFVGGQVKIDTDGNLTVNGKSMFQGTLYASTISPLAGQDLTIQLGDATSTTSANPAPQLSIKNASGSGVFAINQLGDIVASGAANIAKLNFNFVKPAMAVSDTEVVATSSAGTAAIKPYQTQLTIDNANVTANSLIYITPVGNTAATPYLMRQVPGTSFTVGISVPSSKEVNFNWLIVN